MGVRSRFESTRSSVGAKASAVRSKVLPSLPSVDSSSSADDLERELAVSRRQAVKVVGGSLAGVALLTLAVSRGGSPSSNTSTPSGGSVVPGRAMPTARPTGVELGARGYPTEGVVYDHSFPQGRVSVLLPDGSSVDGLYVASNYQESLRISELLCVKYDIDFEFFGVLAKSGSEFVVASERLLADGIAFKVSLPPEGSLTFIADNGFYALFGDTWDIQVWADSQFGGVPGAVLARQDRIVQVSPRKLSLGASYRQQEFAPDVVLVRVGDDVLSAEAVLPFVSLMGSSFAREFKLTVVSVADPLFMSRVAVSSVPFEGVVPTLREGLSSSELNVQDYRVSVSGAVSKVVM